MTDPHPIDIGIGVFRGVIMLVPVVALLYWLGRVVWWSATKKGKGPFERDSYDRRITVHDPNDPPPY